MRPCIRCWTWDPLCSWCKDANPPRESDSVGYLQGRLDLTRRERDLFIRWAKAWKRAAKHIQAQLYCSLEQENARIEEKEDLCLRLEAARKVVEAARKVTHVPDPNHRLLKQAVAEFDARGKG